LSTIIGFFCGEPALLKLLFSVVLLIIGQEHESGKRQEERISLNNPSSAASSGPNCDIGVLSYPFEIGFDWVCFFEASDKVLFHNPFS
jgi:hypothetical protein